jgi:hypothetical protein
MRGGGIAVRTHALRADEMPELFVHTGEGYLALALKPGVSTTHRVDTTKGVGIEVSAQAELKGKVRTFYSTFWPVRADSRCVVVFVDDGSRILVKRFSDAPAPAKSDRKVE